MLQGNKKKRVLQISTDEVFGSLETGTANENSKMNPSNPYAATKAAAELLANSYISTYNLDIVITRCTNNYGPRQFPVKLIPKVIFLAKQNKKNPDHSNTNKTKPHTSIQVSDQHTIDCAYAWSQAWKRFDSEQGGF